MKDYCAVGLNMETWEGLGDLLSLYRDNISGSNQSFHFLKGVSDGNALVKFQNIYFSSCRILRIPMAND